MFNKRLSSLVLLVLSSIFLYPVVFPYSDEGYINSSLEDVYDQGGGYSQEGEDYDPDYRHWRSEQMKQFDSDYDEWRKERRKKFSEDFNTWRSSRNQGSSSSTKK